MDLVLDTHVFLWWDSGSSKLGERAGSVIADPTNSVFVSAASLWEIAIKRRRGKLAFRGSAVEAVGRNGFIELSISGSDAETAGALAWPHSDPFDRMILAQAQARSLVLVTADAAMRDFNGVAQIPAG
ncbi:MAG: type II toxin-antitoxin system VapC family toxin [Caulobacteraceae bacterium]